jgi:mannose-1-phosphate guanylyltransferase
MPEIDLHAVVLAGGSGTRFWPLSTPEWPKQFLALFDDRSLLRHAVDRLLPLIRPENIWLSTGANLVDSARAELPMLPASQYVVEPEARNTLPCIGLACARVREANPDAVVAVVCADHLIRREDAYRAALQDAATSAMGSGDLTTFGIRPTRPETGYGYIRHAGTPARVGAHDVYVAAEFTEKPDRETAGLFVDSGDYLWNSGMFVWSVRAFFAALQAQQPAMHAQLQEMRSDAEVIARIYPTMERVSVDYGLMEPADNVAVIPVDIDWDDVGSWESVWSVWERDADDNAVRGEHLGADTSGCLIFGGDKPVVSLGVEGLVIVDTPDALLVCSRDRAQDLRELAEEALSRRSDKGDTHGN